MRVLTALAIGLMISAVISAQQNPYPHELKGYEFFGNGKLSGLRLITSGKADVRKQFGDNCEKTCNYNSDWRIQFEYFEDIWSISSRNEAGERISYTLDPKYLGKLRSVRLFPTKEIMLGDKDFSALFTRQIVTSTTDGRSGKSRMTVNDAFSDEFGLTYEVFNRTSYDDFRNTPKRTEGELVLISYDLTRAARKALFVLEK